jgi:hypothetical protein
MYLRASLLAATILGAGCVSDDPGVSLDAVQQDIGGGCDTWMCGSNSPQIAEFGFWDLHTPPNAFTPGKPNEAGLSLVRFEKGAGKYLPRVIKGKLIALPITAAPPFNVVLAGSSLVGGSLLLKNGARQFKIQVDATGEVRSWAQPNDPALPTVWLETYLLNWSEMAPDGSYNRFVNMCSHPGGRDDTGMNGPLSFQTLLFEGDRIRATKKTIYDVDTTWFNLGCAGSALAKLALSGHTEAARRAPTVNTNPPERHTLLKMFTGDYCGDGKPFTVAGQPLNWADDRGTMKMAALVASPPRLVVREARWTPDGAACLDKPRVDVHWTLLGEQTFAANGPVLDQVLAHCPGLRPCDGGTLDFNGYHLVTATEPLAPPP